MDQVLEERVGTNVVPLSTLVFQTNYEDKVDIARKILIDIQQEVILVREVFFVEIVVFEVIEKVFTVLGRFLVNVQKLVDLNL